MHLQVPIGEANWFSAWLAILREEIVGVDMTRGEWVSDLWFGRDSRRLGIGTDWNEAEYQARLSGTTSPAGLKCEVASLVGRFALAIGAFAFNTTRRERGPRGDIGVGQCVRYLGIGENLTAVLTSQTPTRHGLKSLYGSM